MVEAHGQLGTLEKALDRYHDIRAGKVGNPPVLDTFMLSGVLYGNNHKQLKDAMEAIAKYEAVKTMFDTGGHQSEHH